MTKLVVVYIANTPVAFLQAESRSVPASARLDRRQEAFAIRLASAQGGPHARLMGTATTGLGKRLRSRWDKRRDSEWRKAWSVRAVFPGVVEVPQLGKEKEKENMIRAAMEEATRQERNPEVVWTDSSRLGGGVGVGIAWYKEVSESEQGPGEVPAEQERERRGGDELI